MHLFLWFHGTSFRDIHLTAFVENAIYSVCFTTIDCIKRSETDSIEFFMDFWIIICIVINLQIGMRNLTEMYDLVKKGYTTFLYLAFQSILPLHLPHLGDESGHSYLLILKPLKVVFLNIGPGLTIKLKRPFGMPNGCWWNRKTVQGNETFAIFSCPIANPSSTCFCWCQSGWGWTVDIRTGQAKRKKGLVCVCM